MFETLFEIVIIISKAFKQLFFRDPYYVMDPANPFNNVMTACNCWDTVAEKARSFLRTAVLFTGVSDFDGWL